MFLLIPLLGVAVIVRVGACWLVARGRSRAAPWNSWSAAAAAGMAAVFVCTGVSHFVEPKRSGLEAIIPGFIPQPALMVSLSGLAEFVLAAGLAVPRTRRWAALASVVFLVAIFPANVVAASEVRHPAAPSTPLLPRTLLQIVFLVCSAAPWFAARSHRRRSAVASEPRRH